MANNYTKILELGLKNNMGLSNTIKRDFGIPLDYSSVQENYAKALDYAKTSTLAYIGQPLSVGDTLYIVTDEANGYLKEVGTRPVGDNDSIVVDQDGKITIKGFAAAADATLPRKNADGTLEWVALDAVVKGDGNTKTIITAADGSDITVIPEYSSATDTYTYTLDVQFPAIPEYTVIKETGNKQVIYKLTKNGIMIGDAIVVPDAYDDSELSSRVSGISADVDSQGSRIAGLESKVEAFDTFFATVENPDSVVDTLSEIQKYITEDAEAAAGIAAGISANTDAIATLTGTGEGSVKKIVDTAIAQQAATDSGTYATQAGLAEVSANVSELTEAFDQKVDETVLDNYYTKTETYSKAEVLDLIDDLNGGSSDSAAAVLVALEEHKAESVAQFNSIESEIASKTAELETRIQDNSDAIAALGGTADFEESARAIAQEEVKALADGQVAKNASAISAVEAKIETTNENVTGLGNRFTELTERVDTLETTSDSLANTVGTLNTTIEKHSTDLDSLQSTVESNHNKTTEAISELESEDARLEAKIQANTDKFAIYYTASEVDNQIDAKIADMDYSEVSSDINANTTAITNEIARSVAEDERLIGLINDNTDAIGTNASNIESLAAAITALDTTIEAVLENDDGEALNSIKELAVWVNEHQTEVIPEIEANKQAIAKLNGEGDGSIIKSISTAIAGLPCATAEAAGLVKASDEITVTADGTLGIGFVSTDKLIQGIEVLVLQGGSAKETPAN